MSEQIKQISLIKQIKSSVGNMRITSHKKCDEKDGGENV